MASWGQAVWILENLKNMINAQTNKISNQVLSARTITFSKNEPSPSNSKAGDIWFVSED